MCRLVHGSTFLLIFALVSLFEIKMPKLTIFVGSTKMSLASILKSAKQRASQSVFFSRTFEEDKYLPRKV